MNQYYLIWFALLELLLSLLIGIGVLFISYLFISKFIVKRYQIANDNLAFAILCSAMLFSIGTIMEGVIDPITNVFRQLNNVHGHFGTVFLKSLQYVFMFLTISMSISILVSVVSVRLYISLTKIDELAEIQKNNLAVAIITATILISISLFTKEPAVQLMEAIIPYPDLPSVL